VPRWGAKIREKRDESMSDERTRVTDATRQAEAEESDAPHSADRPAPAEESAEVEGREVDPDVRAHYREMTELGAEEVGEGRIP
jgi:hypothetical protein